MSTESTIQSEPPKPEAQPTWTEQERWVWNRVCVGEIADFNQADGYGGKLDPKKPEGWPEKRVLRPEFLETILLKEPYRSALPRQGVQIGGAWFRHPVDLSNASLAHPLFLNDCLFGADVNLSHLHTPYLISLSDSKFNGTLDINSSHLESHLFMRSGAEFLDVNLRGAKVGGQLNMIGSKFTGKLDMNNLQVGGSLLMRDRAEFVEVDLGSAKIREQLDMNSSKFRERLNMNSIQVKSHLFMRDKGEFGEVNLGSARIGGQVDMTGSKFTGKLDMDKLQVGSSLFMRGGAEFVEVVLQSATVGNQLDMSRSKFAGKLNMNSLEVENSLIMREGAEFGEIDLVNAKIGGPLDMGSSKFTGRLNMNSLQVGGSLFMRRRAEFVDIDLISTHVARQISMDESKISGSLLMDSLQVGDSFLMRNAEISDSSIVRLIFTKIGTNLDFSGSLLPSVDLTGTVVQRDFVIGLADIPARWYAGSQLTLRNTEVGSLHDLPGAWPDELELEGFTYARLGDFQTDSTTDIATREISWLKEWLAKQKKYSPQPYEQLAGALFRAGYKEKSNEILYAGKDRERSEGTWRNWLWLTLMKAFIGYGFRIKRSIYWALFFIALGVIVLKISGQGRTHGMPVGFSYSFDMLLPLVKLRELHYKIELDGWVRYYFYIHKLMGYVLGSFIIAGLSGLTKK